MNEGTGMIQVKSRETHHDIGQGDGLSNVPVVLDDSTEGLGDEFLHQVEVGVLGLLQRRKRFFYFLNLFSTQDR